MVISALLRTPSAHVGTSIGYLSCYDQGWVIGEEGSLGVPRVCRHFGSRQAGAYTRHTRVLARLHGGPPARQVRMWG
jgi:hypothetical protein